MKTALLTLAAALALAFGAAALAAAERDPGAHQAAVELNQGSKWQTDEPLRQGMENIRAALLAQSHIFHGGDDSRTDYGDAPAGLYAVVHGRVALIARSARGRERVTEIIGPGRSFGEAIMFLEKPYIVGARALNDALVLHVAKETVFAELERNPGFARRIIAALSAKLHATVRELDMYALGSGGQRFAAWLLRAVPAGTVGAAGVTLPVAKRAVASKLNLSAEHLSRVLRELSAEGLVKVHGRKVEIPDVARLRDWSEQPRRA